jgi:1,4-dihydroxy-2-naphthoate octaprenyltransferase
MTFLAGVPVGLLTANILVVNQVPDVEGDASTGKNHLVVTFGAERTPWVYGGILGLSLGAHIAIVLTSPAANMFWWLPAILLVGHGSFIVRHMVAHIGRRTLVRANEQTILLNILYGILFAGIIVLS